MRQKAKIKKISELESKFAWQIRACDEIPDTEFWDGGLYGQYPVLDGRRWRWDFAWPQHRIAVEVQGGLYKRSGARRCRACGQAPVGAHNTPAGYNRDVEKLNAAIIAGWTPIWVTSETIDNGEAIRDLSELFNRVLLVS